MNIVSTSIAAAICSLSALAQQTYVVDAAGNGDFTDLPAAIAVGQNGDRIVVRAGAYGCSPIRTGLRIVADPGVSFVPGTVVEIRDLPAGQRCVLSGFRNPALGYTGEGYAIALCDNLGQVHLEDLETAIRGGGPAVVLSVKDCARVTCVRSRIEGGPATSIGNSSVLFSEVELLGARNWGHPAIDFDGGDLDVVSSRVLGSAVGFSAFSALQVFDGTVRVAGASDVEAGEARAQGATFQPPAVLRAGGTVTIADGVLLNGVAASGPVTPVVMADAATGGAFTVRLPDVGASLMAVAGSLATEPVPTVDGVLWVGGPTFTILAFGAPQTTISFASPLLPPGELVAFQAAAVVNGVATFSLPAAVVSR